MNTKDIRMFCDALDSVREAIKVAEGHVARLECRHGQDTAAVSVCGVQFQVVSLNSAWTPQAVKSTELIRQEALRLKKAELAALHSKAEGFEWKLRQATKFLGGA